MFSSPTGGATLPDTTAQVLIGSSDQAVQGTPVISVADATASEQDGYIDFVVSLSAPSAQSVGLQYQTSDSTAVTGYSSGNDFAGVSATLVFAAGETLKTIRIPLVNDTAAEAIKAFKVSLYSPTNAVLGNSVALGTIVDNDATAGAPVVRVNDAIVDESDGRAYITVTLDKPSASTVTLNYSTADASAIAGTDYQAVVSQVLSFAPGETAKTIAINLIDDTAAELAEAFAILFSNEAGATLTSHRSHVVLSPSDAVPASSPVITVPGAFAMESDGQMEFVISLSAPSTLPVSVYYQMSDNTAISGYSSGNDFAGVNGTLVFGAGETLKTLHVPLVDDSTGESTESFKVTLYSPVNATIGSTAITGTILDNDPTPLSSGITVSSINGPSILEGRGTNDTLVGSTSDNVLIGKGGADSLSGGEGNDLYLVEETGDLVVEASTTGMDTVLSYLNTYALTANVETLLLGSGAVSGSGNELDNILTGNELANVLSGGAGADAINGQGGNDTLNGGLGGDSFILDKSDAGIDTIADFGTGDHIRISNAKLAQSVSSLQVVAGPSVTTLKVSLQALDPSPIEIHLTGQYAPSNFRISGSDIHFNNLPSGTISISGTAARGQTLSVVNLLTDTDGFVLSGANAVSYGWFANGIAIAGATGNTFVPTEAQVGKTLSVIANYTDALGTAESASSVSIGPVGSANYTLTGTVSFSGTTTQGQTLTVVNALADVDGLGLMQYQWLADGSPISLATANTITLAEAQVGKVISVRVSYTDGRGFSESTVSLSSSAVANVNDLPTGLVTIAGTSTQGQTLTATNTLADADGLGTISYQWKANGTAIAGATSSTLTLAEAQVGKTITVAASYTDGQRTAESVASTASAAVANVNDAPTGSVTITGTTSLGQVLTVATNTLADPDGLGPLSYQWSAGGVAISGAINSTLTLSDAQVGKAITVTVRYTDLHGTAESMSSLATSPISSLPPTAVNGTTANDTLTSTAGNDAIDGKAGIDTAVYTARMAAYTVSPTVISGPDGSDTLTSVERLQFTDAFLAFDLDGNAGQTYRLYQAAFNRTPDLGGLGGWIAAMDSGTTLAQVATSFMGSAEFQALYGANPSNEQFVSLLYTNALHRTADAGGLAYWVNQLASGLQTRAQALVNLSESAENKASVLPAIAKGIVYANATQAAGPAKGQSFSGTSNADSLIGTVGNDTLTGGGGNDSLNGGGGLDTAIYSGTRASHTTTNASGALTVSGSTNGVDTLSHVERLKFDDAILAFDTSGNAGQTYRLYQAAFNRTPDKDGLSGWIKGVDQGLSMLKVAAAFIESGEFKTLYGNSPTDSAFVNLLYTNALHRTADAGGLEYWVNQLSSHAQSREQALLGFSESAENQASLIGVIQNGIELTAG